jgi:hypothetical protein
MKRTATIPIAPFFNPAGAGASFVAADSVVIGYLTFGLASIEPAM